MSQELEHKYYKFCCTKCNRPFWIEYGSEAFTQHIKGNLNECCEKEARLINHLVKNEYKG